MIRAAGTGQIAFVVSSGAPTQREKELALSKAKSHAATVSHYRQKYGAPRHGKRKPLQLGDYFQGRQAVQDHVSSLEDGLGAESKELLLPLQAAHGQSYVLSTRYSQFPSTGSSIYEDRRLDTRQTWGMFTNVQSIQTPMPPSYDIQLYSRYLRMSSSSNASNRRKVLASCYTFSFLQGSKIS
jgi:hypothetical protein